MNHLQYLADHCREAYLNAPKACLIWLLYSDKVFQVALAAMNPLQLVYIFFLEAF